MPEVAKIVHADQRYVNALLENDVTTVRRIYEQFSGKVKSYITQNNGTEDDAADIFQESLMDIYLQARHRDLRLTCPFEAFILLICKRKWLNELKKRKLKMVTKEPEELSIAGEDVFVLADQLQLQEEKRKIFVAMFEKLGEKCREIIRWCLSGKPQEEIADALGLSYGYLRKKKSECMATLVESIRSQQNLRK